MKRGLIFLPMLLLLGGCPAFVMGISAAGGIVSIAKDVLDIDMSLRQDKLDKTPIGKVLVP